MFLFLLLIPSIIMLLSLLLWWNKKVSNKVILIIVRVGYYGLALLILINCILTRDDVQSPGIMGGLFIAALILLVNAYQFKIYKRKLNNNRCPYCNSLGLKIMNKDVDIYTNTSTTVYSVKGGRYNGKQYQKVVEDIHKFTTYTNYCEKCNSVIIWTEESEDQLTSDNRPKSLK